MLFQHSIKSFSFPTHSSYILTFERKCSALMFFYTVNYTDILNVDLEKYISV